MISFTFSSFHILLEIFLNTNKLQGVAGGSYDKDYVDAVIHMFPDLNLEKSKFAGKQREEKETNKKMK